MVLASSSLTIAKKSLTAVSSGQLYDVGSTRINDGSTIESSTITHGAPTIASCWSKLKPGSSSAVGTERIFNVGIDCVDDCFGVCCTQTAEDAEDEPDEPMVAMLAAALQLNT